MEQETTNTTERTEMSFWPSALLGAVVSVVTAFVPFSPVLGGGVAGYLHGGSRSDGLRVGAVSGALAAVPVAMIAALAIAVISFVTIVGDAFGAIVLFGGLLLAVVAVVVAVTAGLSALGGYLGAYIREEYDGDDLRRHSVDVEPAV